MVWAVEEIVEPVGSEVWTVGGTEPPGPGAGFAVTEPWFELVVEAQVVVLVGSGSWAVEVIQTWAGLVTELLFELVVEAQAVVLVGSVAWAVEEMTEPLAVVANQQQLVALIQPWVGLLAELWFEVLTELQVVMLTEPEVWVVKVFHLVAESGPEVWVVKAAPGTED